MDAFPAEKYFDHYGWLNYIDSPYKDPELAQRAEKVSETTTAKNVRANMIQKRKKKLEEEIYHEPATHDSPLNTPEPNPSGRSSTESDHDAGSVIVKQSPIGLMHKQAAKQPYTEEEEAWLDLFHAKLRVAVESGREIKLPGATPITEAMNSFIASKNAHSGETGLAPRSVKSLKGKLDRTWLLQERRQLRAMLKDRKNTLVYMPSITVAELEAYQKEGVIADDTGTEGEDEDVGEEEAADEEGSLERKT